MEPNRRAKTFSLGGHLYLNRSKTFTNPDQAVQQEPQLNLEPQQPPRRSGRERKPRTDNDNSATILCHDIANGLEKQKIPVVGPSFAELPQAFEYIKVMKVDYRVERPPQEVYCTCMPGCGEQCRCVQLNGNVHPYRSEDGSVGLFARPYMIFECCKCMCDKNCIMRFSQIGDHELQVFHTGKLKGFGVLTQKAIPRGARIGEYLGELMKVEDYDKTSRYVYDISCLRLLRKAVGVRSPGEELALEIGEADQLALEMGEELNDAVYNVDALKFGNVTRFINHSCDPNCFAQPIVYPSAQMPLSAKLARIVLFASRDIKDWEELTLDYNGNGSTARPCYCESANCSGVQYFD